MIKAENIVLVDTSKIKPWPKNRNKHSEAQIERLIKLIEYQGFRNPLVVSNQNGFLIAGHGRLLAAKKMGIKKVPVVYQDFDNDDQAYAYMVSDNAIQSWSELDLSGINNDMADLGPDFDIDLLGIRGFVIEPAEKLEPQCDEDEVPEKVETKSKLGDIYKLGNHRLMCGDSTNIQHVETLMDGKKADMVFTDPPYGISVQMNQKDTVNKNKILGDDTTQVAVDAFNLCLLFNIPMIFWGANHYIYDAKLPNSKCWIAWNKQEKQNHIDQADCELAWTNINSPARQFHHLWARFRRDSEKGEKRVHPTQKPVQLIIDILEHFNKFSGKSIIDLFGGSGSTLIACEKTNRKCFMMELDPYYCDVIVARWEKYTGGKAELING